MSTRSQIGFYETKTQKLMNPTAMFYKHSDGYPHGVLPTLVPFMHMFIDRRGGGASKELDARYASAWALYALMQEHAGIVKQLAEDMGPRSFRFPDGMDMLGFEFCGAHGHTDRKDFHIDIEYYYAVYADRIVVHTGAPTLNNRIGTVKYRGKKLPKPKVSYTAAQLKALEKRLEDDWELVFFEVTWDKKEEKNRRRRYKQDEIIKRLQGFDDFLVIDTYDDATNRTGFLTSLDIYRLLFCTRLEKLPEMMEDPDPDIRIVVAWRLEQGV